jgi:hypothetical protein
MYYESDPDGHIEFVASEFAEALDCSRRSIYRAANHLRNANLLQIRHSHLGRSRHSIYKVNWSKKPYTQKCVSVINSVNKTLQDLDKWSEQILASGLSFQRKCATVVTSKTINTTLKGERVRRYAMMHFRQLLSQSALTSSEQRRCCQVIGKTIKGKDSAFKTRVWDYLSPRIKAITSPKHCWEDPNKLYPWFRAIINKATT